MTRARKAVLVYRQTRFEALLAQHNTVDQAAFVLRSRGDSIDFYQQEHARYYEALMQVESELSTSARVLRLERQMLPNFLFGKDDLVVVVGQDGTVANTLKYLDDHPVIAVNPDPDNIDGVLLPFKPSEVRMICRSLLNSSMATKAITFASAKMNDGQALLAVNDFFIGPRLPVSVQYELSIDGSKEYQSSSGIVVSTGLGSTGWLKSIATGAAGFLNKQLADETFDWDAKFLKYAVREPFPSSCTGTSLVYGEVRACHPLRIRSKIPSDGMIFSDGMVDDYMDFNSGAVAEFSLSTKRGLLVV